MDPVVAVAVVLVFGLLITVHEAGHFLGLNHTADSLAVMYYAVPYQNEKRVLYTDDIIGSILNAR